MLLGWLYGAASLYALTLSVLEAWGLVRAAQRAEPKRRHLYEWAYLDAKWSDAWRVELRIEAAERAYNWRPGMLLLERQWEAIKTACWLVQAEKAREKSAKQKLVVKINGHCYPVNDLGMKAAVRDGLHPFEAFGAFADERNRREVADLIQKNPIVGDWEDPAWKS